MGNQASSSGHNSRRQKEQSAAQQAKDAVVSIQQGFKAAAKKLDDDGNASQWIDGVCGGAYFENEEPNRRRNRRSKSNSFSDSDGENTFDDDYDDDTLTEGSRTTYESSRGSRRTLEEDGTEGSFVTEYTEEEVSRHNKHSYDSQEDNTTRLAQPLASAFAKRCYFTKAGIGKTFQHYEGLTLTGNVVLMLASAMKLKGCPTICDEDLRRVEQTYPNQFSRLPDELLLSSGWRRISKYCHFSIKPIPDGVPFFHSKQRLHPAGGYFFLVAGAVGMIRPIDVEPLTKDTLVLLETDFPNQCDAAPPTLIDDPKQWTLVDKFCFFSGGPINTEEDVYYQADMNGNPIYMLAFLSPSLTPEELYKIHDDGAPGLKSMDEVQEVEAVYDLTDRDFDDLKLYHLGPCRALPQYILQPNAWTKVLPPHFVAARIEAIARAQEWQGEERGEDNGAQLQREVEEEEGAFPSPTKTASAGSVSARSAVDKSAVEKEEDVDMDAPDPEDPIASPATMLPDVGHFFEEPTSTNHSRNSHSFTEEKKSHEDEDELVGAAADPEAENLPPVDTTINCMTNGEEDFTPIKRDGYTLRNTPASPTSPASAASSTPSVSMRGAQEIIRKKRLNRMEISKKQQASAGREASPEEAEEMLTSPVSTSTWDSKLEEGSMPEVAVLSEESEAEKNSRRAMILNMAKARMRNSSGHMDAAASPLSAADDEWTENPSFSMLSEAQTASTEGDFDIAGDLD